jgi:hypothetical protein
MRDIRLKLPVLALFDVIVDVRKFCRHSLVYSFIIPCPFILSIFPLLDNHRIPGFG